MLPEAWPLWKRSTRPSRKLDGGFLARQFNKSQNASNDSRRKRVPGGHCNVKKGEPVVYQVIEQALHVLNDSRGSTINAIAKFLSQHGYVSQTIPKRLIATVLRRAEIEGIVLKCSGGRYKMKNKGKRKRRSKRRATWGKPLEIQVQSASTKSQLIKKKNELKKTFQDYDLDTLMQAMGAPSPMSIVNVGPVKIPALIDTGAVFSMMSPQTYSHVSDHFPILNQSDAPILRQINLRAANNSPIPIGGVFSADVTVGSQKVKDAYIVVMSQQKPGPDFIVGMNIIRYLKWSDDLPSISLLDLVRVFVKKNERLKKEKKANSKLAISTVSDHGNY